MLRLDDLLLISVRQVLRQWRRNIGVVLAVALGTAGLILVITMGRDIEKNFNEDLELLGRATCIKVYFKHPNDRRWFREETVDSLLEIPGVRGVTRVASKFDRARTAKGKGYHSYKLLGVDGAFWDVNSFSASQGELFGSEDVEARSRVCVLGEELARDIFGHTDVIGKMVPIDRDYYRVVALLGGVSVSDYEQRVFLPLTTASDRIEKMAPPMWLYVRCETWDDVEPVAAAIPKKIKAMQPAGSLQINVGWNALKRVKAMAWGIKLFVNLAVGATLILGGFGIWNVTMSGVRARTREIGLKKAMGAQDMDIMAQFLTEALCLSLGAAIVGVGLGRAGIEVLAPLLGSRLDEGLFFFCVVLGLSFSIILGLGAGFIPSLRASRMEVVSAVRFE